MYSAGCLVSNKVLDRTVYHVWDLVDIKGYLIYNRGEKISFALGVDYGTNAYVSGDSFVTSSSFLLDEGQN